MGHGHQHGCGVVRIHDPGHKKRRPLRTEFSRSLIWSNLRPALPGKLPCLLLATTPPGSRGGLSCPATPTLNREGALSQPPSPRGVRVGNACSVALAASSARSTLGDRRADVLLIGLDRTDALAPAPQARGPGRAPPVASWGSWTAPFCVCGGCAARRNTLRCRLEPSARNRELEPAAFGGAGHDGLPL